jgi:hypothetical protein
MISYKTSRKFGPKDQVSGMIHDLCFSRCGALVASRARFVSGEGAKHTGAEQVVDGVVGWLGVEGLSCALPRSLADNSTHRDPLPAR